MTAHLARALVLGAGLMLGVTQAADAQEVREASAPGTLSGFILDAQSGQPLVGAVVVLEPLDGGVMTDDRRGPFLQRSRSVLTGRDGEYRFVGLPPGQYRVYVRRLGYAVRSLEVDLRRAGHSTISVGLEVRPIALLPMRVIRPVENPFTGSGHGYRHHTPEWVGATPGRPLHRMMPDVQSLTYDQIVEAVTLGETDLFRALQRSPGVSSRDDYTSVLWTRGAPWDHTRVYFDGLPLYNPTHAGWLVSSVNPDGIGAAFFYPGTRDASLGEGAAGVLDLKSRVGGVDGDFGGVAEVSLVSGRIALDGPLPADQGGWMLTARRSYLDLTTRALEALTGGGYSEMPFAFADVVGRIDLRFTEDWAMTASGIWEQDHLEGDLPGIIHGNTARWGNRGGRLTLDGAVGGLKVRNTVGAMLFEALVEERGEDDLAGSLFQERPTDNQVHYGTITTEIAPATEQGTDPAWSVGVGAVGQAVGFAGPVYPPPRVVTSEDHPAVFAGVMQADGMHPRRVEMDDALWYSVLWGERRWRIGERAAIQSGMRIEGGPSVSNAPSIRVAPRMSVRYALDPEFALSASWNRSYQYAQAIIAAGKGIGPELHLSYLWGLAGDEMPAIRSDVASVGVERWLWGSWIASATGYLREAAGVAVPDPTPGALTERPLFVVGRNTAYGVELAARRVAGMWTGSLSYSTGQSEMKAAGLRYPAPSDRTHLIDATGMVRISSDLRLGAALSAASGAPYSRIVGDEPVQVGAPNSHRSRWYSTVDLMGEWTTRFWHMDITGYVQVRNALNRDNAVTYQGSHARCLDVPPADSLTECREIAAIRDRFLPGIPRIPLLGIRVLF